MASVVTLASDVKETAEFGCSWMTKGAHSQRLHGLMAYKKGKAVPLQAWNGPEGSRKLGFSYFMTTAQDGAKVVSLTHRPPLPPGNTPGTHFC